MWIEVTTSSTHSSQQENTRARDHHDFRTSTLPSQKKILCPLEVGFFFCYVFWFVECEWPIQNRTNWKMVHKRKKKASSDSRVSALVINRAGVSSTCLHVRVKHCEIEMKKETKITAKRDKKVSSSSVSSATRRGLSLEFLAWDRKLKSILVKVQPLIYLVTLISVT